MARPSMQPNITTISLAIIGLFLLVLCIWPLLGQPWLLSRSRDLDINSGRLRRQTRVFSLRFGEKTEESALSREIRRLGIQTPATPVWKRTGESYLVRSKFVNYAYGGLYATSGQLLAILELVKAPDDERRSVLTRFMSALQSGDARHAKHQAWLLMAEIGERHDMEVLTPQVKYHVDILRRAEQKQRQQAPDVNEPVH